jgi:hypothetical protein
VDHLAVAAVRDRDHRHFDERVGAHEIGDDGGADGWILGPVSPVDLVHGREVRRILQVDVDRGYHRQARAGLGERQADLIDHALGLRLDVAFQRERT